MKQKNSSLIFVFVIIAIFTLPFFSSESAYGIPIKKDSYEISRSKVDREIGEGIIFRDTIIINNYRDQQIKVTLSTSEEISEVVEFEEAGAIIEPNNFSELYFRVIGKEIKNYQGEIIISGDIIEKIPVNVTVVNESLADGFYIVIKGLQEKFIFADRLDFKVDVRKITSQEIRNVTFSYSIKNPRDNSSYILGTETKDLIGSFQLRKMFKFPEEITQEGTYVLDVMTTYQNRTSLSSTEFLIATPFWSMILFGIPIWLILILLGVVIGIIVGIILIRRAIKRSKKYKMQLYTKTLPKKGDRTFYLGKVAETNTPAYLDMDALTTHGVVAGATGGGKSISAQVIIEEALLKGISVIVFDPTAQWSGMLRKCTDKKMLAYYPKFGLKANEAKAFPGNLRYIKNELQAIDIKKHMNPGQIQIFAMNKLTPPQIDVFVAGVISNIFKSDPKEHPELRVMLVFDEVHRLLPKFGGSGKGFLQIERACREFRKWGFGVMLVSQVLSDFVGEIKANINTEIQMRTRDEADLNRLKTKYGEEFLQSLIKASVGVGMFVNPKYNKGKPYFVNFRPILHNTRRLTDEVLEKYNQYGEVIDDLEFQIEELEKAKVDVFDLRMELKLVKDKLMTGNFTVVDIYLEGLNPRIEKQWGAIGKKPKKKQIELINESELASSLAEAEKGRKEWSEKQEKEKPAEEEKKKPEDKAGKIVAPLTFDNGMMVSSLNEFKDVLPNLDEGVFKSQKADIDKWVSENIDPKLGEKIKGVKTKEEILKLVQGFGKEAPKEGGKEKVEEKKVKPKENIRRVKGEVENAQDSKNLDSTKSGALPTQRTVKKISSVKKQLENDLKLRKEKIAQENEKENTKTTTTKAKPKAVKKK